MGESCILFENGDKSVILIDIPRSLEQAQTLGCQSPGRRIISSKPVETPWQTPESKNQNSEPDISRPAAAVLDELMTLECVRSAYLEITRCYKGCWSLPRICRPQMQDTPPTVSSSLKRKGAESSRDVEQGGDAVPVPPYIPAESHHLLGSIASQRETFLQMAPVFDLLILDPPWPSRSVKRKKDSYQIAFGMQEVEGLLRTLPIASHTNSNSLVAVWVTNKPAVIELLKSPDGMFSQWGLEFIGEWIWVKLTNSGEPVVDLDSKWRKPFERLLVARKKGSSVCVGQKVIFGVPDLHSRKPNLKCLFDGIMPKQYKGLEIFARNLTAGWWCWGDQVLMFQQKHHWVDGSSAVETENLP